MDTETLKIILYVIGGGIILLILIRLASRPKACEVCGEMTHDLYTDENEKDSVLCRNHLVERWKKDVHASSVDMIAVEPDFESYPFGYLYADSEKLLQWKYSKKVVENVEAILNTIPGHVCRECGKTATVAYYKKEEYDFPNMEKLSMTPGYLCKECMTKNIAPAIMSASKDFAEGLYAPMNVRGIFHPQEY